MSSSYLFGDLPQGLKAAILPSRIMLIWHAYDVSKYVLCLALILSTSVVLQLVESFTVAFCCLLCHEIPSVLLKRDNSNLNSTTRKEIQTQKLQIAVNSHKAKVCQ